MDQKLCLNRFNLRLFTITSFAVIGLSACGGSSDEEGTGYINFYNASKNAPAIFLTVDQDLDTDEDDEIERTYSAVDYGNASGNFELPENEYTFELAWQDEDSNDREDLAMVHQASIAIKDETIQLVVMSEDISAPKVNVYDIPVIDDDNDTDDSLFNLRVLNMHSDSEAVDIYFSTPEQSFNEASLFGSYSYQELSANQKISQDEYVFYITLAGSEEVLFQSDGIDFPYSSQYVMVIRENSGAGNSPYILDKVSNSNTEQYLDYDAEAKFRVYNAISNHTLLPYYSGSIDIYINGTAGEPVVSALAQGQFSDAQTLANGDYAVELLDHHNGDEILRNHLLKLPENTNKTVFFYLQEDNVDHDGDGNVDENNDGIVDQIEVSINSLVVDNSVDSGIYDHQIKLINLVDNDDFSSVTFYFVRSNETIATAEYQKAAAYTQPASINLLNNSYQVFAIARVNSSEVVLANFDLVLDQETSELFLVLEAQADSATGYRVKVVEQAAQ